MSFAGYGFWDTCVVEPYRRDDLSEDRTLEDFFVAYDKSGIPLMYERFLTLTVRSTLMRRAEKVAAECGLGKVDTYMMTGGFFTDDVFRHLDETGKGFVMVSDRYAGDRVRRTLERRKGTFEGKDEYEVPGRDIYAVTHMEPFPRTWDEERSVHVFFDPSRRASILKEVYSTMDKMRAEMDEKACTGEFVYNFDYSRFFSVDLEHDACFGEKAQHGGRLLGYTEDKKRIEVETGLAGYYVLMTSGETTAEEAAALLDWKDTDETLFMNRREFLPDFCETSRYGDKSRHLIEFVALILRCEIYRTLRKKNIISPDTGKRMSVEEALRRLDGIKAEKDESGAYALGDVDETQEEILSAFGITKEDFGRIAAETLRRMGG